MRIISDNRDYYDCVQSTDQDRSLVFVRKPITEDLSPRGSYPYTDPWPFPRIDVANVRWDVSRDLSVTAHVIGFCGKLYPALTLRHEVLTVSVNKSESKVCHSPIEVLAFLTAHCRKEAVAKYEKGGSMRQRKLAAMIDSIPSKNRKRPAHSFDRFGVEAFFSEVVASSEKFGHLFTKHSCPTFLASTSHYHRRAQSITFNATLSSVDFYRVFDPYRAYQEISMYLGGIAFPDKPIPKLSDEDMAASKGHSSPYSFRKRPQKQP